MEAPGFDFHGKQGVVQLAEEEIKDLLQAKPDFLEGKITARPWEDIKAKVLNKLRMGALYNNKNFSK